MFLVFKQVLALVLNDLLFFVDLVLQAVAAVIVLASKRLALLPLQLSYLVL